MPETILPRVAALESSVKSLHGEMGNIRNHVEQVQQSVNAGFSEVRRDLMSKSQTNWGWVIAAVAVMVALVSAVGTAWVRPLQANDEAIEKWLDRVQHKVDADHDMLIRLDERERMKQHAP